MRVAEITLCRENFGAKGPRLQNSLAHALQIMLATQKTGMFGLREEALEFEAPSLEEAAGNYLAHQLQAIGCENDDDNRNARNHNNTDQALALASIRVSTQMLLGNADLLDLALCNAWQDASKRLTHHIAQITRAAKPATQTGPTCTTRKHTHTSASAERAGASAKTTALKEQARDLPETAKHTTHTTCRHNPPANTGSETWTQNLKNLDDLIRTLETSHDPAIT